MGTTNYLSEKRGFVILYAVIVSSIVLIVGVSLLNIISKQLNLSYITRSAKQATLTAWSGEECFDQWYKDATEGDANNFFQGVDFEIYCGSPTAPIKVAGSSDGNIHYNHFSFSLDEGKSCVVVNSQAGGSGENIYINARAYGYNIDCTGLVIPGVLWPFDDPRGAPTVLDNNPRVVQKVLDILH